MNKSFGIK